MKKIKNKTKISTITLIMVLTVSAILVILPGAYAQNLIMNTGTTAILDQPHDVDLNGPTSQLEGLKFAYKPPGAADFIITTDPPIDNEPGLPGERYVTDPGGDCDIDWTPTDGKGEYQVKWVLPSTGAESNVVTITVIGIEDIPPRPTFAYIGAIPNPVGVNQEVLLHVGITLGLRSVKMGWEDLSVAIEKPDGSMETLSGIRTDSTGGTGVVYTPTMVGTYKLQTHFPEQITTEDKVAMARGQPAPVGMKMLASSSEVLELVVTEDPAPDYPGHPLPTEYWSRPIDAQIREWYTVSGSWLSTSRRSPQYVTGNEHAPDSAHILWTREMTLGGLAGGEVTGNFAFTHGDAYEGKFDSRLIINGILIYTHRTNTRPLVYTAVDLHTGEELWTKTFLDNRTIAFGQTLLWAGYNHHAVYPYLWVTKGSSWYAFDPYTGDWEFTVEHVPPGRNIYDDQGWIYRYNFNLGKGEGYLWSLTDLIIPFGVDSPVAGSWLPGGSFYGRRYSTYDAAGVDRAYVLNFTFPSGLPGNVRAVKLGDRVVGSSVSQTEVRVWAFSLEPGHEGALLFDKTWTAPPEWKSESLTVEHNAISIDEGILIVRTTENVVNYGFSTETGDYLWKTEPQHYLNYFGTGGERVPVIAYGKYFSTGIAGIIYCNDVETGELLWKYEAYDPYNEILWTNNWWQYIVFVTDGKLYAGHLEHSAFEPMPRGGPFLCLDVETGEEVWRADGMFRQTMWGGLGIIGDSIIATMDTYDCRVYAVGKGPSRITVEAPLTASEWGQKIVLRGTVTDISPGTQTNEIKMRFPDGVPAVSDGDMSEWMLHVYKQFPCPIASGVPVKLEVVVDPNGNWYDIGIAYTDASGFYSIDWEPPVPGHYLILASFAGSKSYYPSYVETSVIVDEGLTPGAFMEPEFLTPTGTEQQTTAPLISTEAAVFAAVAFACLISIGNYLVIRKRK
jgi:hypothetical protein